MATHDSKTALDERASVLLDCFAIYHYLAWSRGGGWTQAKGLTPVAPFEVGFLAYTNLVGGVDRFDSSQTRQEQGIVERMEILRETMATHQIEVEQAARRVAAQEGVLRIGMGSGPGAMLMTPLLMQMALQRPQLHLEIARGGTELPPHRAQAIQVIHRGGEHLLSLIEGTLDIARIESGKLALDVKPMAFADAMVEGTALMKRPLDVSTLNDFSRAMITRLIANARNQG